MLRNLAFVVGYAVILVLSTANSVPAGQFGTAEEARAMLGESSRCCEERQGKSTRYDEQGRGRL
jgi:hypothetical protein